MPKKLQQFTTTYGDFWMEVEAPEEQQGQSDTPPATRGMRDISVTQDAQSAASGFGIPMDFDRSVAGILPMIRKIRDMASTMGLKEVEVEVGAKFAKKVNLFVVSGGADVDFRIKFKWEVNRKPEAPADPDTLSTT